MKKIVTMGGGGGHSQVLTALKDVSNIQITAICPSTDSGGSTGVLQKEYGGKGYGDLTKCMAALCPDERIAKRLLSRYDHGPFVDHSIKNLLLFSLEEVFGPKVALQRMSDICGIAPHSVVPVAWESSELCARLQFGGEVSGETNIDLLARNPLWNPNTHSIVDVYLRPAVPASREAVKALKEADLIIVCPGDLYSSIIPTLLPKGATEAIKRSEAVIVIILNLMTKKGETDGYTANDFVRQTEKRLGRKADFILCNNKPIPKAILARYSLESKVEMGTLAKNLDARFRFAPLAMITEDKQVRSDPKAISKALKDIISAR